MSHLSPDELSGFRARLVARGDELRREIAEQLADSGRQDFEEIIGLLRDSGEDSVADLIATVNIGMLDRDVRELREVEAALARIADGSYGDCRECGGRIVPERLQANPTAERCIDCQRRAEHRQTGGLDPSPSL